MKRSYYAVIPADVRYDKELTPNAKLLYGEITALCNEKGYCWASDSYFMELYGVGRSTIQRWIKQLEDRGYIYRKTKHKEGTKQIERRYIYLRDTLYPKMRHPIPKNETPYTQNWDTPIPKNETDNNTINNTINSSSSSNTATADNEFSKIVQAFEQNGFGLINQYTKEFLVDLVETYSSSWVLDAIEEAVKSNVRKLKYVEAILKRWQAEGKGTEKPKPKKEESSNWRRSDRRL